ncbi:uncharacterized protein LOC132736772 [Ruditapes philippinarum]|uniref:uncharacterized protein LOC132736772 n=1 Tax=Ruditapes philippinarum TaxID=129788 RepID=UPI00295B70F0|nr:uncharacterized protein LOC132736772 [Ruditapes philippinarum]
MPTKEEEEEEKKKVEKERANWTKAISGLNITKCGLIISIHKSLKDFLCSFSKEQLDHLSEFFENIQNSHLEFVTEKGEKKGSWKIAKGKCESDLCQEILDLSWEKHVNKSKKVVWSPGKEKSGLYNRNNVNWRFASSFNEKCSVCLKINCPFERYRKGLALFDDKPQENVVDKYYWQFANMYMFRGQEKNNFPNTRPEDTESALIFKLMKNCKLFSLDEENEIDNWIYDDLLEVRNLLMHSVDNRLSDDAFEECFKRMKTILEASMFSNEYSTKAVYELEQLKGMRIIMTSLTAEEAAVVKAAFKSQQSSLEFDIEFSGSLKNDLVLKGILKASIINSVQFTKSPTQVK